MPRMPNAIEQKRFDEVVEMIERENRIAEYSATPGPMVLSGVKGISPIEAAERLWEIQEPRIKGVTNVFALGLSLGKKVESAAIVKDENISWKYNEKANIAQTVEGMNRGRGVIKFSDRFPNLTEWMEKNRGRIAILKIGHAFAYVAMGVMIKQFGFEGMRGKVTHVIWLDR